MSALKKNRRQTPSQIFAIPFAIGVASAIGLVVALVGDGLWDAVGWLGLGIPLVITGWCLWRRRLPA